MTLHDSCLASVLFDHFSVDHPLRVARQKSTGKMLSKLILFIVHYDVTRRGSVAGMT